ncbi:MAG: hypothetical protein HC842_09660, partial [Cytophagales bacterium]|nr:hypothetical protein [Cytophagales bacterium]
EETCPGISHLPITRIINSHTVDMQPRGELQFLLGHRFGQLNSGFTNLYGLDEASMRLGLEYGLARRWAIGAGRSTLLKTWDGYSKLKLLTQTEDRSVPLSIVLVNGVHVRQLPYAFTDLDVESSHYLSYSHQVLLAHKLDTRFSFQLMPTLVHRNLVSAEEGANDLWALGAGGRWKLTKRFALTTEYYYIFF